MRNLVALVLSFVLLSVAFPHCDAGGRQMKSESDTNVQINVSNDCVSHIRGLIFDDDKPSMEGLMKMGRKAPVIVKSLMSGNNPCTNWIKQLMNYGIQFLQRLGIDVSQIKNMLSMFG